MCWSYLNKIDQCDTVLCIILSHTVISPDLSHKPSRSLSCHQPHVPKLLTFSHMFWRFLQLPMSSTASDVLPCLLMISMCSDSSAPLQTHLQSEYQLQFPLVSFSVWSAFQNRTLCMRVQRTSWSQVLCFPPTDDANRPLCVKYTQWPTWGHG